MGWRDWLSLPAVGTAASPDRAAGALARIEAALEALGPERARFVAAFAYHLGRIAHADHELTGAEREVMRMLIAQESGLPPEQVATVVDLVVHESLVFRGTEDYRVMREFDEIATVDQKLALIRCLFALSAADSQVVTSEDNEIRRIALALKISHDDFVRARATVREHLAVLKRKSEL